MVSVGCRGEIMTVNKSCYYGINCAEETAILNADDDDARISVLY